MTARRRWKAGPWRVALAALCGGVMVLCSAGSANAAIVTVGDSSTTATDWFGQSSGVVQTGSSANSYSFSSAGIVSSFQTRAWNINYPSAVTAAAVIYRGSGPSYTIVARANPATLGPSGTVSTGTFSPAVTIQPGDRLGIETSSGFAPYFVNTGSTADVFSYYMGAGAPVNGSQTTQGSISRYRASVSVPLVTSPGLATCVLTAVRRAGSPGFAGAFDQGDVTVTASNGLVSISSVQVSNGAVSVPTFTPGTTAPVIVTTTKSSQGQITRFSFDATDGGAVTKHCA